MTDHLITSIDASPIDLRVPYICKAFCKLERFLIYPRCRGFKFNAARLLIVDESQHEELASLLQEWLYFGLIQEFLGAPLDLSEFLRPVSNSDQQVLDSSALYRVFRECRARLLGLATRSREELCRKLLAQVSIAIVHCRYFDQDRPWTQQYHLPEILLSIRLLIDSLIIIIDEFDTTADITTKHQRYPIDTEIDHVPPSASILIGHMLRNGFCPHQAQLICARFTYNTVYYLASFSRTYSTRGHEKCEREDHCVSNNMDPGCYRSRHVRVDCSCEMISIPSAATSKIIEQGGIPIIALTQTSSGDVQRSVFQADYSTQYTAISHVWNDGLGNPYQNGLPKCQVKRLIKQVRAVDHAHEKAKTERRKQGHHPLNGSSCCVNIWMDTFCIPLNNERLKMKAINRMSPTYKRATNVLVLDAELTASIVLKRSEDPPLMETCAHLVMAAWNQRCWTLQEGALAQILDIPTRRCSPSSCHTASRQAQYIHKELHRAHQLPAVGRWKGNGNRSVRQRQFIGVWNALIGRSTTQTKDLHGIFANLLDFHAEEIILLAPSQRMKALLCAQQSLPIKLLYDKSPRHVLHAPLDRWIPDIPKGSLISESDPQMSINAGGLFITSEEAMGRTIIVHHERRISPITQYVVNIENIAKIMVSMQPTSAQGYTNSTFDKTVLHIAHDAEHALNYGLTASGASFTLIKMDQNMLRVAYQDPVTLRMWEHVCHDAALPVLPCFDGEFTAASQGISIDIDIGTAYKPRFRRQANRAFKDRTGSVIYGLVIPLLPLVCGVTVILFSISSGGDKAFKMLPLILLLTCMMCGPFAYSWFREREYRAWLRSYEDLNRIRRNFSW